MVRLDRILRRYLLNSGIDKVFVENMITEYGVGNPNDIQDDVRSYVEQNVVPIYEGKQISFLVLKTGNPASVPLPVGVTPSTAEVGVRGDLINSDKIKYGYIPDPNFTLSQRTALTYSFEYSLDPNQNYSLTFNFVTGKI